IPGQGRAMAAAAAEIGELKCESRHFVVGGQRRALEVNELPGLPDGGVLGFVRDVTHVEESQDELERHIEAHAEVLNNLSTAIAIFGPDKRMSYHNSAYAKLWQLDEDWLSGRPLHGEILDELRENRRIPEQTDFPAYKQEFIRLYTDLLATQEDVIYPPDGRVLRQVISPHPFGGLLFLTEDITDSLVLERSYNTLIAVQRETLDNLYEGVAVYGGDGRLRLFNSAFATIWQLDERLLETEPHVSEIIDSARDLFAEHETWNELRELLISQATGRDTLSGRMERPDERIIDFAGVALPDGNMLFTYIDVTDSANVERALLERYEALETADRLKSEFLANVSYELRTPLNVIIGFAEVLANEYFGTLNDRQKEYTGDILNSSHQLLDLINAILDLASIEAGQLELEPAVFDVRTMLENVISLGRERAQKQQLHLSIDCPVDFGTIEGDERRLKQVLYNLLSNSLKYSDRRGEITVGVSDEGDEVGLYVADNGIGIAEADQQLVFEKFRRGSLTERQHSVGLGLSLVKSFIELHGGRVVMDSQVGEGTRVTCHLPRQQPAVPTQLSAPLTEFGDVPVAVLPSSDTRL
ncbi:MAG: PAS-domain containing protein, partial [Alphaproteobacteria bacterium]|nr:PAS-domain containing protein [Alphaproteobacteria bacterium]